MADSSSVNDVFRFIQLRPQRSVRSTGVVALARDTDLVKALSVARTGPSRTQIANEVLARGGLHRVADAPLGPAILSAIDDLRASAQAGEEQPTAVQLHAAVTGLRALQSGPSGRVVRAALSDLLLAARYATAGRPPEIAELQDIYRVYCLDAGEAGTMASFLARPLLAPELEPLDPPRPPTASRAYAATATTAVVPEADASQATALRRGIAELLAFDNPGALVQPDDSGAVGKDRVAFTLTRSARQRISTATAAVLQERAIDPAETPLDIVVNALDEEYRRNRPLVWPLPPIDVLPDATLPPAPGRALVRPAGIADLLVVKQQIKRYEGGEIAHVENVLIGEKKSRAHRTLDRTEDTFTTETETTRTQESELQSTDRFELNRETSQTIKTDQKTGISLSLSGKYGPAVEFTSKADTSVGSSQEESSKSASTYARDVMSRSLERVTERVREARTRTVIHETEETNLHELDNDTTRHIRGVYQFLDKIYETQVFNYGIRQMFDFMVPEPASFLWYVAGHPSLDVDLPPPPPKLELVAPDASYIDQGNALALAALYGATDVEPAPPPYRLLTANVKHGEDDADEEGQPHSAQRVDLTVPAGYRALRARVRGLAFTDENPVIAVAIGSRNVVWRPGTSGRVPLSDGRQLVHEPELALRLDLDPYELADGAKLGLSVLAWETNTYSLEFVVVARRTADELSRWRIATYRKIRSAYDDRVREHDTLVADLKSDAEAKAEKANQLPLGAPPAMNVQTAEVELKKHCLSIITQQRYDAFDATKDGAPPFFDFADAAAEGSYIRFFEQAFEWDQMQYVLYPYFWSRKSTWIDRFVKQDVDPTYLEFLRAGAARVVVPVRPGFEIAVVHFLETGALWSGEGDPPQIQSPLYVSIVDEIRERTGAPQGEIPVGDPWDARVPTALVYARADDDLPTWQRTSANAWQWQPADGG